MPELSSYDEKELLLLISDGNEAAFEIFFRQTSPLVKRWVLKLVKEDMDSVEVLQDVYIQIWLYRDKLPAVINIFSWLKTVTSHQCFKYLRRQKLYYQHFNAEVNDISHQSQSAENDQLNYKDTQSIIEKTLGGLTPQQQQIYRLSRQEELKSEEIAARLSISRGHVRNSISIILSAIRDNLRRADKLFILIWMLVLKNF